MKFIFDNARASVLKNNQIAICGYGDEELASDLFFDAKLLDKNTENACVLHAIKSSMPPLKRVEIQDTDITSLIVLLVDVPDGLLKDSVVVVTCKDGKEITRLTGRKINEITGKLNCCLDGVIVRDKEVELRGWALNYDVFDFIVHKEAQNKCWDISVSRHEREDIICLYPEYKGDKAIGFSVKYCLAKEKLYFTMISGDKKVTQKIIGTDTESSSLFITKLKRNSYKFFLCLKNMGLKVTLQKVKAKMTSKHLKKPKAYDKWIRKHLCTDEELKNQKEHKFSYEPKFYIMSKNADISVFDNQTYSGICSDIEACDYILMWNENSIPEPNLFYEYAKTINNIDSDVLYSDNDMIDLLNNRYVKPNFKPDMNIDLLRSCNYIGCNYVVKKSVIDNLGLPDDSLGLEKEYDYLLRCFETTQNITHVPKVLYHEILGNQKQINNKTKYVLESHLSRMGIKAQVKLQDDINALHVNYDIEDNPLVSIIIPNKDHADDLKKCIDSIDSLSAYKNYEFVIIENNSVEKKTFSYYEELSKRDCVKVVKWDKEFNYSAINNFGVSYADGEYVLLLNNDTEIMDGECLAEMLGYCQRDEVGIVGARLYYDDGAIQHAGVIVGYGGIAGHAFVGLFEKDNLYQNRTKMTCDYSAVTAACLMTKKTIFEQVGGLDESFMVAFNDIDFCLRVRELGKLVVYNPHARLYHYESKSRGLEDTPAKKERFRQETEKFLVKWSEILRDGDPYYNINLALDRPDFSVRG